MSSIIFHLDKNFDAIYIYYLDKIFAIIYIYHLQWKFRYLAKHWYKHKPYEQKYVVAFRNPIQPNVQATTHSCQFTPVQTQNYTIRHNEKMKMALDSHLLQSINITAFFSYILIIEL